MFESSSNSSLPRKRSNTNETCSHVVSDADLSLQQVTQSSSLLESDHTPDRPLKRRPSLLTSTETPVCGSAQRRIFASLLARSRQLPGNSNYNHLMDKEGRWATRRAKIVDRFVTLLGVFKQSEATLFRAVQMLDKYVTETPRKVDRRTFQLTSISALRLAARLEETRPMKLIDFLEKSVKDRFTKQEVVDWEMEILSVAGFSMSPPTELDLMLFAFDVLALDEGQSGETFRKVALRLLRRCLFCLETRVSFSAREIAAFCLIYVLRVFLVEKEAESIFASKVD